MTDQDQPPMSGGFNGWWVATAILVFAVAIGAFVLVVGVPGSKAPKTVSTVTPHGEIQTTGSNESPASTTGQGSTCPSSTGSLTVPSTGPVAHWEAVQTILLPWSDTAGPTVRGGIIWRCYAHTPTGALLAATVLGSTSSMPGNVEVLRQQVAPGPNRDAALHAAQTQPPQHPQPGQSAAFAGFRILAYDATQATVQVVGAGSGKYVVFTFTVVWRDGDWVLSLDSPSGIVPPQVVAGLEGFTPWGAA